MYALVWRSSRLVLDWVALSAAWWLAWMARFDWVLPDGYRATVWSLWVPLVVFQYGLLWLGDIPRSSWRHVGLREVERIAGVFAISAVVLAAFRFGLDAWLGPGDAWRVGVVPLGVILMNTALGFLGVAGQRVVRRIWAERQGAAKVGLERRTLLVGAGQVGAQVCKELGLHRAFRLVGFLDDDPHKRGQLLNGVPVLGSTDDLLEVARSEPFDEVLITIAACPGSLIRKVTEACEALGLRPKIVPTAWEIMVGGVSVTRLRQVALEDLLRRDPVALDTERLRGSLRGRSVLITGAGGSIGSELSRQIAAFAPRRLTLLERAEPALFEIHQELLRVFCGVEVVPRVGDVRDRERVEEVLREGEVEVVFHAAAHKHVPLLEWNPGEAIKNNALGTQVLAEAAHATGVERFVSISTDKAVNPSSVMGASKRLAELYVQARAEASATRFVSVRFGNVLGSRGSVVPLFRAQIAGGGPVTVTHRDMTRYFMTIPEASQLVLEASVLGESGEVLILDMGEPVRIVDLAYDLIRLSGLRPGEDVEVVFTGLRPGEKLHEDLVQEAEAVDRTRHPKLLIGRAPGRTLGELREAFAELSELVERGDHEALRAQLQVLVPGYCGEVAVVGGER